MLTSTTQSIPPAEPVLNPPKRSEINANYTHISQTDFLDGLARLAITGTVEMTEVIEEIHCELMLRPLGKFEQQHIINWKSGLSGRGYAAVKHMVMVLGNNLTSVLRLYDYVEKTGLPTKSLTVAETLKLLVNVVNGVMGDHLVNQDNPIATCMQFYDSYGKPMVDGVSNQAGNLSGQVVVLTHGLCMSHLSWRLGEADGFGERILQNDKNTTVLYLDYNTGQHISKNGRKFANLLQQLVDKNPAITQIDLIGHSMGGLVSRSALFYGDKQQQSWFGLIGNLITLGSPHHGAMLERISYYVLDVISKVPFAGTLAKMGDIRSAGIIDLRHGSIRDEDWEHLDERTGLSHDIRIPTPLPSHINTYLVAGSLEPSVLTGKTSGAIGDSLVAIDSALGEHKGNYVLDVPEGHKAIFYGVGHMALQYNERVCEQILYWLSLNKGKTTKGDTNKPTYKSSAHMVPNRRIESYPVKFDVAV